MPDDARPRFYLTTSIAYANNKPGIHTLYEVIGADVLARWHRMIGDDTLFLTGTDEHSINIAQTAIDAGRAPREFVDEQVGYFKAAEDALVISADRFIRTTDPDHAEAAREMIRRAYAAGPLGYLVAGPLIEWIGVRNTFITMAVALFGVVLMTLFMRELRGLDDEPIEGGADHLGPVDCVKTTEPARNPSPQPL